MPVSSCTPASLADAAKCFGGMTAIQRESIALYLLEQIAGLSLTPAQLAAAAKCFGPIAADKVLAKSVETYLLCQISSA